MSTDSRPSDEEIQHRLDFADGALGAAGHKVDDPESRALMREVASGEKTADEAVAELKAGIKDA